MTMSKSEFSRKLVRAYQARTAVLAANKDWVLAQFGIADDDEDREAFWRGLLVSSSPLWTQRRRAALAAVKSEEL